MIPCSYQHRFEGPELFKGRLFVYWLTACTNYYHASNRTGKARAHCQQRRSILKRFVASVNKCKLYTWRKGIEVYCLDGSTIKYAYCSK